MNRAIAAGATLSGLGVAGYAAGVWTAYPGRAFSVTALMIGITSLVIGASDHGRDDSDTSGDGTGNEKTDRDEEVAG